MRRDEAIIRLQAELADLAASHITDLARDIRVLRRGLPAAEVWELADPEDAAAMGLLVDDDAILLRLKGTDIVVEAYPEVMIQRARTRAETLPIRLLNAKTARRREQVAREHGNSVWRDSTEPAWIAEAFAEAEAAEAEAGEKTE